MGKNAQSKGRSSAPSRGTGCEYTMPYLSPGPLYGLAFNFRDPRFSSLLAAAGKQGASVFCLAMETKASDADFLPGKDEDAASGSRGYLPCEKLLPVMTFKDEDEREDYFSCAWASGEEGEPLLVVGGFCGIVKVLDVSTGKLRQALRGHGNCINSITVKPARNAQAGDGGGEGDLVMTASKDESIRMWNLKTSTCVMVFAGAGGHTAEITSVDYSVYNGMMISCGLDNSVKIWDMTDRSDIIALSQRWDDHPSSFPTAFVQFPNFSSSKVHDNFVDCVKWFGNNILSKSVDDTILHWCIMEDEDDGKKKTVAATSSADGIDDAEGLPPSPCGSPEKVSAKSAARIKGKQYQQEADYMLLNTLHLCDLSIWFIKFSMDFKLTKLACGNHAGVVHVWSLTGDHPKLISKLSMNKARRPIRQTALSYDGRVVAACTDNGEVWTWCPWKTNGARSAMLHQFNDNDSG